ncbi:MAG: hypothetical protein GXO88_07315 [Chlorobi bacterium]|nr:hypothetical protein [Chlorobiota bacterium]
MKKIITIITVLVFLFAIPTINLAQQTSPGDPGGEPTGSDPPLGGGAPIGGGLFILIGLGAAYGGKKIYKLYKDGEETLEE